MENAIKRFERLDFEDGFDTAKPANRPNTKAKEGGSLYVENSDLVRIRLLHSQILGTNEHHSPRWYWGLSQDSYLWSTNKQTDQQIPGPDEVAPSL